MKFGTSYSLDKLQIADLVAAKRIGFDFVEFYISQFWDDFEELELQLLAIRDILDSYDLFSIIHLPHLNSNLIIDTDLWTNFIDIINQEIRLIGRLGISTKLVLHGMFGGSEDPKGLSKDEIIKAKDHAIKEWLTIAEEYQIDILLENLDESIIDLKKAFKRHKKLGFTFDIAHANIVFPDSPHKSADEKIYSIIEALKKKIHHIHISDNFGGNNESADTHLPIGTGNIDFKKFFRKLKDLKYNKTITFEVHNPEFQTIYLEASLKAIKQILNEI